MGKYLRVLLIEDSEDDAFLLMRELHRRQYEAKYLRVETAEAMRTALRQQTWDVILSDYTMPNFSALQALEIVKSQGLDLPFIIISGTIGEETAVAALKAGAHDFLIKGNWSRLEPIIEQELHEAEKRRERQQLSVPGQELFGNAFRHSPVGICITGLDGRIQKISQSFLDLLGFEREELEGQPFAEITHPEDVEIGQTQRARMLEGDVSSVSFEKRYLRKDGGALWALVSSSLLRDRSGKPLHFITHILDLTEHKRQEQQLRQSEENFSKAFRSSPTALMITRLSDGQYLELNEAYCNIVGYDRSELLGHLTTEFNIYVYPEQRQEIVRKLMTDGSLYNYEATIQDKSGNLHTVLASVEQIQFNGENSLLTTLLDITERKQAEEFIRYQSDLLQNVSDAIIGCDLQFHVTTWNPAAEQVYGWTAEEVIGKPVDEFLQTQYEHADMQQALQEFMQNGIWRGEAIQSRKDGIRIIVLSAVSEVKDRDGKTLGVVAINRDITERKQAEEQIQRQVKHLRALRMIDTAINSSFDMRVTLDLILQQVVIQLGVDACAILLLSTDVQKMEYTVSLGFRHTLLNKTQLNWGEGYASQVILQRRTIHVLGAMESGGKLSKSSQIAREEFVDYYGTPLLVKGEVKGVLEIYHRTSLKALPEWLDFVEILAGQAAIAIDNGQLFENLQRSNMELEQRVIERTAELNLTNAELEHANQIKNEFLANMSHELRTPLTSILGLSEALLEQKHQPLSEYQQKSLEIIQSSGTHLLNLINDILDLSKIEAGKFDYYPQPLNVNDICNSSLAFVRAQALKKSIEMSYTNEAALSKIYADPRRLKQVLVNLLSNAVKFTPEHGHVHLQVVTDLKHDLIQFSVIDDGIGIAADDLQRLFQPFVQLDSRLNRQHEGTGLGLVLVQRLTDLHGGSVSVESEPGKGSRFTVNLPCRPEAVAQFEVSDAPTAQPQGNAESPHDSPAAGPVVLLADDNEATILTIGDYLKSHGYGVVVAHNGLEAIEKAEECDIILMDIQMPVLSGLDAIVRLRTQPQHKNTPIIALTALAMAGDRERCLAAGATEYIGKPVGLKFLRQEINRLLENGQAS